MGFFSEFKNEIKILGVVLASTVIILVGGILLLKVVADTYAPCEQADEQESASEKINTSAWQTYRNDEYGFEVKYPEGYIVEKAGEVIEIVDAENSSSLGISFEKSDKDLEEIIAGLSTDEFLAGERVLRVFSLRDSLGSSTTYYMPIRPGVTLVMKSNVPIGQGDLFNRFLSTFRFVDEKENLE
jgi:hypothetical protein